MARIGAIGLFQQALIRGDGDPWRSVCPFRRSFCPPRRSAYESGSITFFGTMRFRREKRQMPQETT